MLVLFLLSNFWLCPHFPYICCVVWFLCRCCLLSFNWFRFFSSLICVILLMLFLLQIFYFCFWFRYSSVVSAVNICWCSFCFYYISSLLLGFALVICSFLSCDSFLSFYVVHIFRSLICDIFSLISMSYLFQLNTYFLFSGFLYAFTYVSLSKKYWVASIADKFLWW